MLLTVSIYVLALFSVLSDNLLIISTLITIIFIGLIIKNILPLKYIVVWTLLFYLGIINTSTRLREQDDLLNLAPLNSEITGTIISIPQKTENNKIKFFFTVDEIVASGIKKDFKEEKVLVTLENYEIKDLKLYSSASLKGRLSVPFKAGNPSQFDYGNYLRNHNTYAVFYAKTYLPINKELTIKQKFIQKIGNYRENIIKIHSKYLESPKLEILGGIVFGDDAVNPPKNIKKSFVNSGLLHILAASGMNVAFIYTFFFLIFSRLRLNFKLSVILSMLTVIVYSLMTGLGASVIRATGMLLFVLIGKLIDRDAHSISLLSFVGLLMLLYNPLFINDVGFQLSFVVTFGILLMSNAIIKLENKFYNYILGIVAIPIIAQLWVIPIQIFYFNNISLYSVFANIMSVPILMIISFGGFVSSLLAGIVPISDFICKTFDFILNPLLSILTNISDFWGKLPNSSIQTTHPSIFQILLYYILLCTFTAFMHKEIREKYSKVLYKTFFILLFILIITFIPIKNKNLEILTFDVGNADCFLIKTPNNKYIMIDTGKSGYNGGKSQAEIIILKYLKDKGIKNFEFIIVTHFDNDHCGGASDLLNSLHINKIYVNDLNHDSISAETIYETAKLNNTEVILAKNEQVIFNESGLKLTNYLGLSTDNDNENSIITLLEYNDFKMLFTGDAGIVGLNKILTEIPENIDILKAPHHGAIKSINKEIIKYLNPKYSIISVGENKFGHPGVYTLALLKQSNIIRTDINNSILVKVNKKDFMIYTYDLKKRKFIKY